MKVEAGVRLGAYTIAGQVGRGGMATVYRAHRDDLDRDVAVKVLPDFFSDEPGFRERFQQEAKAVAKLRHVNIPVVFDYGEDGGRAFMVSEYVDGGTLDAQLGHPMPIHSVVAVLAPIASALDYAHSMDVIHRDVKPSNILMRKDGTPLLSDFGLAKITGSAISLTRAGSILGTPEYMSPEQCAGETLTPASDLYSLAVLAYQMLTGEKPFTAQTPAAVLVAQLTAPLPLPRKVNPKLPIGVEVALLKGLAKAPADRPSSCAAFVAGLAEGAKEPDREVLPRWLLALVGLGALLTIANAVFDISAAVNVWRDPAASVQCQGVCPAIPDSIIDAALQLLLVAVTVIAALGLWRGATWWRAVSTWGLALFGLVFGVKTAVLPLFFTIVMHAYAPGNQESALWFSYTYGVEWLILTIPYLVFLIGLWRRTEWARPLGWLVSGVGAVTGASGLAVLSLCALRREWSPRTGR